MATGRIGVTPTLRTRWSKQPSAGTTSLSGLDDNSISLVYDVGYEAVYRNGVLLSRGNDYTATSGTSITLIDATLTGDVIEVLANQLVPLNDAISKGQFTAKGALLSATAASTPGVITVGANDTVLTADSTTSTGLKWATPAAGGMTLISTTTLTGASVTLSSIPSTYVDLRLIIRNFRPATDAEQLMMRINGDATANRHRETESYGALAAEPFNTTRIRLSNDADNGASLSTIHTTLYDYANTATWKTTFTTGITVNQTTTTNFNSYTATGSYNQTTAISSLDLFPLSGNFTSGTVLLYGVK